MICKIYDFYFIVLFLGILCSKCLAEEETDDESTTVDRNSLSSIRLPNDMSLPASMQHLGTVAAGVALGVVCAGGVLVLLLPLVGVRLCNILGNCEHTGITSYSGSGIGHNYDAYNTAGAYNQPSLSYANTKRSLEYVGPILKALSTAYDKYAVPFIKKKE